MLTQKTKDFLDQNRDRKIVFTNGCFDIVHRGHLEYLKEAKACGDLLFLGLNSDCSVRRLKGEDRPINNEDDRKFLLESLRFVDCVEIFKEDTPYKLIDLVKPNVLVKGGDWKVDQIVGSDLVINSGGEVFSLKFLEGKSTTNIIKKVQGKE